MASAEKRDRSSKVSGGAPPRRPGEGSPARRAVAALRSPEDSASSELPEKKQPSGDVRLERDVMVENIQLMLSEARQSLPAVMEKMPEKAQKLNDSLSAFEQLFKDIQQDSARPDINNELSELQDQVIDWARDEFNPAFFTEAQKPSASPAPPVDNESPATAPAPDLEQPPELPPLAEDEEEDGGERRGRGGKEKNRRAQRRFKRDARQVGTAEVFATSRNSRPAVLPKPARPAPAGDVLPPGTFGPEPAPTPAEPPPAPEPAPAAPQAGEGEKGAALDGEREQALSAVPAAVTMEDFDTVINVFSNHARRGSWELQEEMPGLIAFATRLKKKNSATEAGRMGAVRRFNGIFKKILAKYSELDLGGLKFSLEVALAQKRSAPRAKKQPPEPAPAEPTPTPEPQAPAEPPPAPADETEEVSDTDTEVVQGPAIEPLTPEAAPEPAPAGPPVEDDEGRPAILASGGRDEEVETQEETPLMKEYYAVGKELADFREKLSSHRFKHELIDRFAARLAKYDNLFYAISDRGINPNPALAPRVLGVIEGHLWQMKDEASALIADLGQINSDQSI